MFSCPPFSERSPPKGGSCSSKPTRVLDPGDLDVVVCRTARDWRAWRWRTSNPRAPFVFRRDWVLADRIRDGNRHGGSRRVHRRSTEPQERLLDGCGERLVPTREVETTAARCRPANHDRCVRERRGRKRNGRFDGNAEADRNAHADVERGTTTEPTQCEGSESNSSRSSAWDSPTGKH